MMKNTFKKMNMECKRCLFTDDIVKIFPDGECEYCRLHDKLIKESSPWRLQHFLIDIREKGMKRKYDCLIGISGGFDSSLLLEYAVKKWNLKPLVIHFDNGWNEEFAEHNMDVMVNALNVDFIRYRVNKKEYDDCCRAFLHASVPDADIPNDIIMTKLMYEAARIYKIKYILNGHCFKTEGSTPAKWTYMDAKYIRSVYKNYTGEEISSLPLLTILDQIRYGFLGIRHIRPFHHMEIDRLKEITRLKSMYGWMDYPVKHGENIFTAFIGYGYLPVKFNIDKRRVYLSAQIRSGLLSRANAMKKLAERTDTQRLEDLVKVRLGINDKEMQDIFLDDHNDHSDFETYNFKRWRLIIWLLVKINILPYTFYKKYCTK